MSLTKSQKKSIKKNLKKLSFEETAAKAGITEETLVDYLKEILPPEKFQKIQKRQTGSLAIPPNTASFFNLKSFFLKNGHIFGLLALLVGIVYFNSLGNEFLSDDIAGILQDKHMGDFAYYLKYHTINFSRYFFYSIVFHLFGLNQVFFRLINVIFHLGSVWVIYCLLSLIKNRRLALIVAGIFAVHPLLSESVTWISGGLYAQYGFFVLLSFLLYLLAKNNCWQPKYFWGSVAAFIPALLTTEKAAVLPGLLFFYELVFGSLKKNWSKLIPYAILSGIIVLMVFGGGQLSGRINSLRTNYYQESGFYNPLTQIPTAIASYLWLTVWPDQLTLYHSEMVFNNLQYALMFILTTAFFALLAYCLVKPKYRQYGFWLAFFFISLTPMLTPLKVAWIVAERYVYLGSLGLFVIIGTGIEKLDEKLKNKNASLVVLGVLLVILSARTIIRNVDWKNQDNLWLAAARTSPSSPQNHNNLGDLYSRRKEFDKAVAEFKTAIALLPNYGDAYHNLANTYLQMNQVELAIENYQNALKYNPNIWQSHQNLAAIYAQLNRLDLSEEHLKKALEFSPQLPNLHFTMGIVYREQGKTKEAKEEFLKTLELEPGHENAKKFLETLK